MCDRCPSEEDSDPDRPLVRLPNGDVHPHEYGNLTKEEWKDFNAGLKVTNCDDLNNSDVDHNIVEEIQDRNTTETTTNTKKGKTDSSSSSSTKKTPSITRFIQNSPSSTKHSSKFASQSYSSSKKSTKLPRSSSGTWISRTPKRKQQIEEKRINRKIDRACQREIEKKNKVDLPIGTIVEKKFKNFGAWRYLEDICEHIRTMPTMLHCIALHCCSQSFCSLLATRR